MKKELKRVGVHELVIGRYYCTNPDGKTKLLLKRRTPDWLLMELVHGELLIHPEFNGLYRFHNLPVIGSFYEVPEPSKMKRSRW